MRDSSERKQAEDELAQSRRRLAGIVESAMDAIITVDDRQRIVLFNRAAEIMFRCPAAEALGSPVERFIPERFRRAHAEDMRHFGETGQTNRRMGRLGDISGLRADGEEFPAEASISQVDIGEGKLFSVILRDITDRKRAEAEIVFRAEELGRVNEALLASQSQLQAVNRELDDFATIVSHDLKAPLRGVATLAKWIESDYADKLDAEGRENLAEMVKRVVRMDRMIEGILHYSRLGRTEEKPEPVPLDPLVADIVQDLAPGGHMHVRVMSGLPVVYGEAVLLRQVFQNLVGNAVQHGDKVETEVRVEFADHGPFWEFRVADNGPGIEERNFERIFKMFQTLAPKDTTDSTGVGLALVKRIVERAGGRIWVESLPGEGSTFHFTWPKDLRALPGNSDTKSSEEAETSALQRNSPITIAPRKPMINNKSLLLVEDDDLDAKTVQRALRELHLTNPLVRVTNGEEALAWLRDPANGQPGLILLDLNLPVISGIEFLQAAKGDERLRQIPVVVLTTSRLERDKLASFALSVAGYMVKPVDYVQFIEVVRAIDLYWTLSETP